MKKGFTLIEIIISIVLIIAVGTTSTFIFLNSNNKNEEIENITKQVLEAANAYINVEKDDNGNTYKNGISRGGKGVQLSVQNLIDKGYLEDNQINTLERYTDLDSKELYILAAITVLDESECGENVIEYTASWYKNSEDPIYLCGYKSDKDIDKKLLGTTYTCNDIVLHYTPLTYELMEYYGGCENVLSKNSMNFANDYEELSADYHYAINLNKFNGIFKSNNNQVYYRGNVHNNYVYLNGELFRILQFTYVYGSSGYIKLIKENAIDEKYLKNSDSACPSIQNTDANNCILESLNEWFSDFKTKDDGINDEVFITNDYCTDLIDIEDFNKEVFFCRDYFNNRYSGLLSVNAALAAGACGTYSGGGGGPTYGTAFSGANEYAYICDTFLSSGSSTLLADLTDNWTSYLSRQYVALTNDPLENATTGLITYYEEYSLNDPSVIGIVAKIIRPVISLDLSKINIESGIGLKEHPYVLKYDKWEDNLIWS